METSKMRSVSNTLAFSSIVLSIVCFVALVQAEVELRAHRKMLQVLTHHKEGNVAPSQTGNNELIAFPPHGYSSKETHSRHKRSSKNKIKKSNTSLIVSRDDIKREVQLALSSLACKVNCPRGMRERRGRPGPLVAAIIIQKPSSVIVEEGENVTLLCKASGRPTPTVTWVRAFIGHLPKGKTALLHGKLTIQNVAKADSGTYACSAKNFLGKDSAFALITVTDRLKFTQTPPLKVSTEEKSNLMLNCAAQGTMVIIWKRAGQCLPQNHVVYRNGTLLLRNLSPKDAGSYTCVAKNAYRSIEARTVVKVLVVWVDYTPQWCTFSYRRQLKFGGGVTLAQCKQLCPGCAAIEYWSGGVKVCYECLDHTKRESFTYTKDTAYPPHVYIRQ